MNSIDLGVARMPWLRQGGEALRHPHVPVGVCGPFGAGGESLGAAALLWALEFRDTVDVALGERGHHCKVLSEILR